MPFQEKQLAQNRPTATTVVTFYTVPADTTATMRIIVTNTTSLAASYRIFVDDDGAVFDQTSAIAYDVSIPGNTSVVVPERGQIAMNVAGGSVGVRTDTANAITFTAFGVEIT